MQHMTEEQLVAHFYGDDEASGAQSLNHLRDCVECARQLETLRGVLALVDEAPVPERGEDYGAAVWNRLRWKIGHDRTRSGWKPLAAIAATLALAFAAGLFWRNPPPVRAVSQPQTAAAREGATDRLVFVVVGDHLEDSERVLLEVANADPKNSVTLAADRAADLLNSNRIYRQTAVQRGDEQIARLLSDIEPILIELSHAGAALDGEKLAELQKRIESKELLFKVRVVSAETADRTRPAAITGVDSL